MKELLKKVENLYDIRKITSYEKVEKGFLTENYKISSNKSRFFLKRYRFNDEDKIKEVHSAKKYFSDGGIPVIMPLETKEDKTYFEDKGFYFALFPFVSGLQPQRGDLTEKMITSLGEMLAKIHLLGRYSSVETKEVFSGWDIEKSLETIKELRYKLMQIDDKTEFDDLASRAITLKERLIRENRVNYESFDFSNNHLIHGDYLDQNVFFNKDGTVKYVFDFEKTKREPRTQELFRSATYSFLNTDFNKTSINNIRLYISAYLKIYPIDEQEIKDGLMVHYLKSINGFWVEKEHYLKNNKRVDLFLELNYKRIEFLSENLDTLTEQIT